MENKKIIIALAGNPNTGKTTIFNALTGLHHKVGNYPGVTVEKKVGERRYKDYEIIIYDLPGIYSLTAYSIDEMVARDFIINEKPDIIVNVLDSNNIERNLYLCMQFQELNIPIVGALNLTDEAERKGIIIDEKKLSDILRIPLVKTVGVKNIGLENLLDKVIEVVEQGSTHFNASYGAELEIEIKDIIKILENDKEFIEKYPIRWFAIKLLEKDKKAFEILESHKNKDKLKIMLNDKIKKIERHFGRDAEIVVTEQRYAYIHGAVLESVSRKPIFQSDITETIDKIVLNKILSLPIFIFIMWAIFQLTFKVGEYPIQWLESFFNWFGRIIGSLLPEGLLNSLLVDGIIAGVGGVFSFVPLIVILFLFISILEDTGYMSRIAFIMDKILHIFGLHGQSFLPMILGFGCSVPAVMAARTLKSAKDRIITILIIPFMSCGAKLPVHILLAGAFFPNSQANAVIAIYVIGVILALGSAYIFRKTILRGEATAFVMELPPYRIPTLRGILFHMWEKTYQYIKKAGTIILAASILIWAITTFPQIKYNEKEYEKIAEEYKIKIRADNSINSSEKINELTAQHIDIVKKQKALEYSIAGRIGKLIEPIVRPIGFDWKIGISAVTGFAAKEIVVSTLGILYKVGAEEGEESESLRTALRNDKIFNKLVAFVLMLFTLIIAPCVAAQAAIKAEIGWKWLGLFVGYSTIIAWLVCFAVYQFGNLII
ncbi:MAG TPA: ferrous iron transport protein B [bacterium]|nr:ferrous iron transport protein B [bacterium]